MVGQFLVPVSSLESTLFKRPQYYNVIDGEGKLQGKILARFYLLKRDPQQQDDEKVSNCYKYMKQMIENRPHIVDLKVSVLGVRALAKASEHAEIEVSLTNYENVHGITVQDAYKKVKKKKDGKRGDDDEDQGPVENEETNILGPGYRELEKQDGIIYKNDGSIQIRQRKAEEDSDEKKMTKNPNFGKVVVFEQIMLQEDMILWPHLIFKFFNDGMGTEAKPNPESSRIVLPIFIFAESFMNHQEVKMSLAMLMDNRLSENQRQQNPIMIYCEQLQTQIGIVKSEIPRYLQLEIDDKEEV